MFNSLKKLDKKMVLLQVQYRLEFSSGEKRLRNGSEEDKNKVQDYNNRRNECIKSIDDVNSKITFKIRKEYSYDSLDDLGKKCIDNIVENHLSNLNSQASKFVAEQRNKEKAKTYKKKY